MSSRWLLHGSSALVERELAPRSSRVLDSESAVFATDQRWLALVFIPRHTDADLDIGFYGDDPYIEEVYPGAFDLLKRASGYIYTVDGAVFHGDRRLGMLDHEFICDTAVPIRSTEVVADVWEALKQTGVHLISK